MQLNDFLHFYVFTFSDSARKINVLACVTNYRLSKVDSVEVVVLGTIQTSHFAASKPETVADISHIDHSAAFCNSIDKTIVTNGS